LFGKHDYALQRLLLGNALRGNIAAWLDARGGNPSQDAPLFTVLIQGIA
jgi:hypothetical protein